MTVSFGSVCVLVVVYEGSHGPLKCATLRRLIEVSTGVRAVYRCGPQSTNRFSKRKETHNRWPGAVARGIRRRRAPYFL